MGFSLKKLVSYETDIWAVGIVKAPITDFLKAELPTDITWLHPDKSYRFVADPFGIWHQDKLYVFVEALDYRIKKGIIDCFVLDKNFTLLERFPVLEEAVHVTYPNIIKQGDDIYMIPESSRAGETWIYKAVDFPRKWEKVKPVMAGIPMIDPSFIFHDGLWWVFYSLPGEHNRAYKELHISYGKSLLGTMTPHAHNPVSVNIHHSRPGGTPFSHEGKIHLPVQNCSPVYGASLNILRIDEISPTHFKAEVVKEILPQFSTRYPDGLHTLSACGDVTLIDCKYFNNSPYRNIIDWQRRLGRMFPSLVQ